MTPKLWALTPDLASWLGEHLAEILGAGKVISAVAAIDVAAAFTKSEISPGEFRRHQARERAHLIAVATAAEALVDLLRTESPAGRAFRVEADFGWGVRWDVFDEDLRKVLRTARGMAGLFDPPPRGRPPDGWRDRLIATIHNVYPAGTAKQTPGSHFEQTVEMVLGDIRPDVENENVHSLVVEALRRRSSPTPWSPR